MNAFIVMLSLLFALPQAPTVKRMSDREHAGFIGPVKKVFVEWSPVDRPFNDISPGTRCRKQTDSYDKEGRLIQNSVYPGSCGSEEIREYYTYGTDGSRTEVTDASGASGIPSGPPPIAGASLDREPGQPRVVFQYDSTGRLTEASTIRPSGKMIDKSAYSYDANSRVQEVRGYNNDGKVSSRRVYTYDGVRKVPSGYAYYDGDGKLHEEITYSDYEFNSYGDWVKRKETRQERVYVSGQTVSRKSISSTYRQIEYY